MVVLMQEMKLSTGSEEVNAVVDTAKGRLPLRGFISNSCA